MRILGESSRISVWKHVVIHDNSKKHLPRFVLLHQGVCISQGSVERAHLNACKVFVMCCRSLHPERNCSDRWQKQVKERGRKRVNESIDGS